jgi:Trm5-related predicted tRNA methylase
VCFDLAYGECMDEAERRALAHQLAQCYGHHRRQQLPLRLAVASLRAAAERAGAGRTVLDELGRWQWEHWQMLREDASPDVAFAGRRVVYLTADSPTPLERLEPGGVYVVGGLVDRTLKPGEACPY